MGSVRSPHARPVLELSMRALILVALVTGCISAQFNSTTGKSYAPLTSRALILSPQEAQAVESRGEVIGTVSARSPRSATDNEDLAAQAAKIAAEHGGTHIVVASFGTEERTYTTPESTTEQCTRKDDTRTCQTTYTPASSWTASYPTGEFTVIRVAKETWASLPPGLQPR
jgi:hypothetical protein